MDKRAALARAIVGAIDFLERRGQRVPADLAAFRYAHRPAQISVFADAAPSASAPALRGEAITGRKPAAIAAVNAYQTALQDAYTQWADDLADELADASEDDRDDIIAAAVAALLLLLKKKGKDALSKAAALGLGVGGDAAAKLAAANIAENERYLTDSLGPALEARIKTGLQSDDILGAIAAGGGAAAIAGMLGGATARVGSYAGQFWKAYNQGAGQAAQEKGKRIKWVLDEQAQHCPDCLEFGDREYDSYEDLLAATGGVTPSHGTECQAWCRCELQEID